MSNLEIHRGSCDKGERKVIDVTCADGLVAVHFPMYSNGFRMTPETAIEFADHLVAFAEMAKIESMPVDDNGRV